MFFRSPPIVVLHWDRFILTTLKKKKWELGDSIPVSTASAPGEQPPILSLPRAAREFRDEEQPPIPDSSPPERHKGNFKLPSDWDKGDGTSKPLQTGRRI